VYIFVVHEAIWFLLASDIRFTIPATKLQFSFEIQRIQRKKGEWVGKMHDIWVHVQTSVAEKCRSVVDNYEKHGA
jgi:hypothetical protein